MSTQGQYRWRSLASRASLTQKPLQALLSVLIRGCSILLPERIKLRYKRLQLLQAESQLEGGSSPIQGMMVESIERAPLREASIVSTLVKSLRAAKEHQKNTSKVYLPGADWKTLLETQWEKWHEAINRQDYSVAAAFLRNFFRNEGLSGFWGGDRMYELFAGLDGMDSLERARLMRRQFETWQSELPGTLTEELDAPHIGNPWGYIVEGSLLIEPICEYHYQARYFARLVSELSRPVILEIGGGFGGLAYQIFKHIPHVKYIGFDLPENVFLQSYYLMCAYPELKVLTYNEAFKSDDIAGYDIILLPNFMLPEVEAAVADLIVNIRSLSEMPQDTIVEYHRQIDRLGRMFFFHENIFKRRLDRWHGIPSSEFPHLRHFVLAAQSESRWPRYARGSGYPCRENLYIHRSVMRR